MEAKTTLVVKPLQTRPPPVIVYGPQNQTVPVNTQALLECLATSVSEGLFAGEVAGQGRQRLQSQYLADEKVQVGWMKDGLPLNAQFDSVRYVVGQSDVGVWPSLFFEWGAWTKCLGSVPGRNAIYMMNGIYMMNLSDEFM